MINGDKYCKTVFNLKDVNFNSKGNTRVFNHPTLGVAVASRKEGSGPLKEDTIMVVKKGKKKDECFASELNFCQWPRN